MAKFWWNRETGDEEEETETPQKQPFEDFVTQVEEVVQAEGYIGYKMGKPILFNYDLGFQICVLDPHMEIPQQILLIQGEAASLLSGKLPHIVKHEDFLYKYNPDKENYFFNVQNAEIEKTLPECGLGGTFDHQGDITKIEIMD